jgi:hypothetical protein
MKQIYNSYFGKPWQKSTGIFFGGFHGVEKF